MMSFLTSDSLCPQRHQPATRAGAALARATSESAKETGKPHSSPLGTPEDHLPSFEGSLLKVLRLTALTAPAPGEGRPPNPCNTSLLGSASICLPRDKRASERQTLDS